jgi:hypothetical protein
LESFFFLRRVLYEVNVSAASPTCSKGLITALAHLQHPGPGPPQLDVALDSLRLRVVSARTVTVRWVGMRIEAPAVGAPLLLEAGKPEAAVTPVPRPQLAIITKARPLL